MKHLLSDIVMQRPGWNRCETVTDADESAGGKNHLHDTSRFNIHGQIFHLAEFLPLVVFDRQSDDFSRLNTPAERLSAADIGESIMTRIRFG